MKLRIDENEIEGKWIFNGSEIIGDENCQRIYELISKHLVYLTDDISGWNRLYQDPIDKRYWELLYPKSELHGGGPPFLKNITEKEARQKYSW